MAHSPGVKFIYLFCNDLEAIRHFYTDLLHLHEIYFSDGQSVAYDCDGLQFTIMFDADVKPALAGWGWQPGWQAGRNSVVSWSVVLDEEAFKTAVTKLTLSGVESYYDKPQWKNYWSFPVKDPMGNTVEVVLPLDNQPEYSEWDEYTLTQ